MFRMEKRGDAIYFTEDGGVTWHRLDHILEHRDHIRAVDEIRQELTRRREWYRRMVVSRDMPNSKAARADYCDGGSWERMLVKWLDGELTHDRQTPPCVIAKRNCQRIARRLMLNHWKSVGQFVAAVWKNGNAGREKTMADFGIGERQYQRRCALYARLLGWRC